MVLFGTYFLVIVVFVLVVINFIQTQKPQTIGPLMVSGIALMYTVAGHVLLRRNYRRAVSYMLVVFYFVVASGIVWSWGVNTPLGLLLFGLVVVLAGILLPAQRALSAAAGATIMLLGIQTAITLGWYLPDTFWATTQSTYSDVLASCAVFAMLALVSWLYNREVSRSMAQTEKARAALARQRDTLEIQVEQRTAQLRAVQLEEMQQLYRYSEIGQFGITLLHDLANQLTALTLEIDELQSKQQSEAITRAQRIMEYLGEVVDDTRNRLHGGTKKQTFDIIHKINQAVEFLRYKAAREGIVVEWKPPTGPWMYTGDPVTLCQVVAIIVNNAIDAYSKTPGRVLVGIELNNGQIVIKISDWGQGFTESKRKQVFAPSKSKKKTGFGLGLSIAKQTIETEFAGTIELSPLRKHTEFIIKLPLQ